MACGEFAEPIYKLITDLGDTEEARELVFNNLVKYLHGEEIERFVESFRQDYDLDESIVQTHFDPEVDAPTEDMEVESDFFSSKIPEC